MGEWRGRHRLITLDELLKAVMGEIDECRMSLYGLHKVLQSRDFGPAQLLPALESLDGMARRHRASVERFADRLRHDVRVERAWREPLNLSLGEVSEVLGDIVDAVAERGRLGAKARLELEARIVLLGSRLECVREVVVAVVLAARGQTRPCQLSHLLSSESKTIGAYAVGPQKLWVVDDDEPFEVTAEAWRLVIHQQLRWLFEAGHAEVVVWRGVDDTITVVGRGELGTAELSDVTLEQTELMLRPTCPFELEMAQTIAAELGIVTEREPGRVRVREVLSHRRPSGQRTAS